MFEFWILIPAALLVALYLVYNSKKDLPIHWDTLMEVMAEPSEYAVNKNPNDQGLQADFGITFSSSHETVTYFVFEDNGFRAETLEVLRRGYYGFVGTFINDEAVLVQRARGPMNNVLQLSTQQRAALKSLLKRIRFHAAKYRT